MKKLNIALLAIPLVTMAGMAHAAAVDLSPLEEVKDNIGLASVGLMSVVLLGFGIRRVARVFGG